MKILRITGSINRDKSKLTVTEIEAEEKGKTYHIQSEISWMGPRYVKKENFNVVASIFRNEISDKGGFASFYFYCLPSDEEAGISAIKTALSEYMKGLVDSVRKMQTAFKYLNMERKIAEDPYKKGVDIKLQNKILKTK